LPRQRRRARTHARTHSPARPLRRSALKAKDVWLFGELLDIAAIRGLATTEQAEWLRLLEIFAYGKFLFIASWWCQPCSARAAGEAVATRGAGNSTSCS